ncbi:alpha/beta hydrolase [Janibacter alkaliphilus]|uniref:Alpha-beta hydrolase superfamily lysophospholipase n=1 Tax=Janibacter alkaliphilus TaxID=1069963 RepID=A0A852X1F1_9MICO|nr:alpha-beta hydrolase superfamily lysophospholipase [Janibacter alkaliphilus]
MAANPYADFLPADRRAAAAREPRSTWWEWRGHRVHIARATDAQAAARVMVVHGAGGYSRALWPVAALLADEGLDVAAVDLPLYGRTSSPAPESVRYDDWVRLLVDLVDAEDDGRPLILFGASIGGLLALEVAARSARVAVVAATCLLDPADRRARARMTRFGPLGVLGRPVSHLARGRIASLSIPMRWVADLPVMGRDPQLGALCARDPLGGGAKVPLGFLASYMLYQHTPPEQVRTPVVLLHPAEDQWTPAELSVRVLRRLGSPGRLVMLRECGHFPVEEPGLTELITSVLGVAEDLRERSAGEPRPPTTT